MRQSLILATALIFAFNVGAANAAAPCRDAKGKFTKCATAKAATHCRDVKTKKFAKCGLPGTEPMP